MKKFWQSSWRFCWPRLRRWLSAMKPFTRHSRPRAKCFPWKQACAWKAKPANIRKPGDYASVEALSGQVSYADGVVTCPDRGRPGRVL